MSLTKEEVADLLAACPVEEEEEKKLSTEEEEEKVKKKEEGKEWDLRTKPLIDYCRQLLLDSSPHRCPPPPIGCLLSVSPPTEPFPFVPPRPLGFWQLKRKEDTFATTGELSLLYNTLFPEHGEERGVQHLNVTPSQNGQGQG
jgi:hypothetical protein